MLTFDELATVNAARAARWHGEKEHWNVVDWSNAMAGEAGEVCNAVKKLRRIECGVKQMKGPQTREEAINAIAMEIGDTLCYLDLLAQHLGLRLEDCIRDTFNRVSVRENLPERL